MLKYLFYIMEQTDHFWLAAMRKLGQLRLLRLAIPTVPDEGKCTLPLFNRTEVKVTFVCAN